MRIFYYLPSVVIRLPQIPSIHFMPPLLCHHSPSLSCYLFLASFCLPPDIAPDPLWWNCGWCWLFFFFFSVLQQALIAGLSHKHTDLLYLELATPCFNRQLNAPLTTLCILHNHLKRLQLNHYCKEGRKQKWGGRWEGKRNEPEKIQKMYKKARGLAWDKWEIKHYFSMQEGGKKPKAGKI